MYYRHKKTNGHSFDFFDTTQSYREEVEEFIKTWNQHVWLVNISGSDRQARNIRDAMARPFFKKNWRGSFSIIAKSSYLMRGNWFGIDWYLQPDNFDKIVDGCYLDDKYKVQLPHPELDPNREETL